MKQYIITIEETVSDSFEIYAENDQDAERIVAEKYKKGEIVLEPGNLISKQMEIENVTEGYCTEWREF